MTAKDFTDGLEARTYQDEDGLVGVYELEASEAGALWLSERLFRQPTLVARAYALHTLPVHGGEGPWSPSLRPTRAGLRPAASALSICT